MMPPPPNDRRANQPSAPADPRAAPAVPPDVLRDVTRLSQAPGANPYVLAPPPAGDPLRFGTATTDRVLAALAHGAIIFGFLGIGFLITLGFNLVLWIAARNSPYIGYHARQAGCYQVFVVLSNILLLFLALLCGGFALAYPQWGFMGILATVLGIVTAGWFVGSIVYGVVGAILVLLGRPFAYPVFGRGAPR